jgi:hypothetical protein
VRGLPEAIDFAGGLVAEEDLADGICLEPLGALAKIEDWAFCCSR